MPDPLTRTAALARQLERYLRRPRRAWPTGSPNAKRAMTYRRRTIVDCLKRIRSIETQGTESGWLVYTLDRHDRALVEALASSETGLVFMKLPFVRRRVE